MKRFTSDSPPPSYYEPAENVYFYCENCGRHTRDQGLESGLCDAEGCLSWENIEKGKATMGKEILFQILDGAKGVVVHKEHGLISVWHAANPPWRFEDIVNVYRVTDGKRVDVWGEGYGSLTPKTFKDNAHSNVDNQQWGE